VIATATGGSAEYLRDGVNALVVARDDPAGRGRGRPPSGRRPTLRARLREGGLATAREHTAERFHARVEAALMDVVRAARAGR